MARSNGNVFSNVKANGPIVFGALAAGNGWLQLFVFYNCEVDGPKVYTNHASNAPTRPQKRKYAQPARGYRTRCWVGVRSFRSDIAIE